jgi:hypothetical protein
VGATSGCNCDIDGGVGSGGAAVLPRRGLGVRAAGSSRREVCSRRAGVLGGGPPNPAPRLIWDRLVALWCGTARAAPAGGGVRRFVGSACPAM